MNSKTLTKISNNRSNMGNSIISNSFENSRIVWKKIIKMAINKLTTNKIN